MSPEYPQVAPCVSISGDSLHRHVAAQLTAAMAAEAEQLIGQPMMLDKCYSLMSAYFYKVQCNLFNMVQVTITFFGQALYIYHYSSCRCCSCWATSPKKPKCPSLQLRPPCWSGGDSLPHSKTPSCCLPILFRASALWASQQRAANLLLNQGPSGLWCTTEWSTVQC